jgi:E3 ubiquitin-protein ligase SHPRH
VIGDEYDNSLIIQEKCDIYQDIYQDILRDRHYWVNGVWQAPRVANLQEDNDTRYNDTQNEVKRLPLSIKEKANDCFDE